MADNCLSSEYDLYRSSGRVAVCGPVPQKVVVLSDTHRPEETAIIDRWCQGLAAMIVQKRQTTTIIKVA